MHKAKIFCFTVFTLVVFAFVFHVTAMGHHHWKKATAKNTTVDDLNEITIGLFTRCTPSKTYQTETCVPNKYPRNNDCFILNECLRRTANESCPCDFLPSTKGIASCTIIASVFLGLSIIILFIHSINTSETNSLGLLLSFFPLILLLLAFIFILIALILVGSYLSRDMMHALREQNLSNDLSLLRQTAADRYTIRIDWSTGLEIIALVLTFFSFILYNVFVFKIGRSP
ncbi:unnamed protein product [Rotaria sp. Silwood2]|nr:unnamed protein product [Rotaria sp. Silwood2]CAF2782213.1 unnamed protein product [Rotaria sp. Silwood2]CAF4412168.1 unnamed protein product [Rotaria sp. Silwood2]CAF4438769.1 unnamed protein product [Rotaria sp. Silwood2]